MRDTVRAVLLLAISALRVTGSGPPASLAFWVNEFDDYFTRSDSDHAWRYLDRRLMSAADYVAEPGPVTRPKCLNGRRQ